ncbi:MAG TPA: hypothetical protein VLI06_11125 [Solimonas sp.]|nr:hypothetical protein [Solimonas sp.]
MQIKLPAFGAIIPGQGGRLAAIMRGPIADGVELPPYALLVTDMEIESVKWGEYKDIVGTTSRTDGRTNTAAMLAAGCPAAMRLAELNADGRRDLYIPSLGELNAAAGNVPELFAPEGVYWTSTQLSRGSAFVQCFEDGDSRWYRKGLEFRVRAVRQIPLELLIA